MAETTLEMEYSYKTRMFFLGLLQKIESIPGTTFVGGDGKDLTDDVCATQKLKLLTIYLLLANG